MSSVHVQSEKRKIYIAWSEFEKTFKRLSIPLGVAARDEGIEVSVVIPLASPSALKV